MTSNPPTRRTQCYTLKETISGLPLSYSTGRFLTDFGYTWQIDKMKHYLESRIAISLEFLLSRGYNIQLDFEVQQTEEEENAIPWFCVNAKISGNKKHLLHGSPSYEHLFTLAVINGKGDRCCIKEGLTLDIWERFVDLPTLTDLLVKDQLILHFQVFSQYSRPSCCSGSFQLPKDKELLLSQTKNKFCSDMITLWERREYTDFIYVVQGTEFKVHKAILAAHSAVFAALFAHENTKECQEGRSVITDIGVETFEQLLKFVYTGIIPQTEYLTEDLLVAADKYAILQLKSACEAALFTTITPESASNLLTFADLNAANELKEKCIQFIAANSGEVMTVDSWKQLELANTPLVKETYRKIVEFLTGKHSKTAKPTKCVVKK